MNLCLLSVMLLASAEHLMNPLHVCGKVIIKEKNVIQHLDTILQPLECYVAAVALGVTSSFLTHGTSAVPKAAKRGDENCMVVILLSKFQLPVPTHSISCC